MEWGCPHLQPLGQVGLPEVIRSIFDSLLDSLPEKSSATSSLGLSLLSPPGSWEERLLRPFTGRGACPCLLGTGFLWPQHPSEEALGESSREDS